MTLKYGNEKEARMAGRKETNEHPVIEDRSDSEVAKIVSRFGEIIEDQTLRLLNKLPIS